MVLKSRLGLATINHSYTEEERRVLSSFQSLDYMPPHSKVYRQWLQQQPGRHDWDRWLMMALIGFSVGMIGFLLHQVIDLIAEVKWHFTQKLLAEAILADESFIHVWFSTFAYSSVFVVIGAILVVYQPAAAASGIPEIIGFLNGTRIKHIFKFQTLVVKFLSCAFAVGSGLPVGYEGPMIHLGSLVAAGFSQFKSSTFECSAPCFSRFRNSEDRRNFISAGAAAGIASAFGAPVGGLLFAMEEVSSFWTSKLSWQVFFCCIVATFTTDLLNSCFHGFKYGQGFGLFHNKFTTKDLMPVNVIAVLPSIAIGLFGGITGAIFVRINVIMAGQRKKLYSYINNFRAISIVIKVAEPLAILTIMTTIHVFLPSLLGCTSIDCQYLAERQRSNSTTSQLTREDINNGTYNNATSQAFDIFTNINNECFAYPLDENVSKSPKRTDASVKVESPVPRSRFENNLAFYTCGVQEEAIEEPQHDSFHNVKSDSSSQELHWRRRRGNFSESATLLFGTGERAVYHLFSKNTHTQFSSYATMFTLLIIHFFMACWSAGTSLSSGLVVPMLLIGGLYGRIFGSFLVDTFGVQKNKYWAWMDPGTFAVLGAVSFFGGVTRLSLSLTVIMVEITNDIHQLLLIMIVIMTAKWTGDLLSHPLYHALIEFKCIPFLGHEPMIIKSDGTVMNLDLFTAEDIMTPDVKTVNIMASVHSIARILTESTHCGFPVIKDLGVGAEATFSGEITRLELRNLMTRPELFLRKSNLNMRVRMPHMSDIMHPHFRVAGRSPHLATDELLHQYINEPIYADYYVNLIPYTNDSGVSVQLQFSLYRAYILFRTLGLRHMTVVSPTNQVQGIITRRDLMGSFIEERLQRLLSCPGRKLSKSVVLALKKKYGGFSRRESEDCGLNADKSPVKTVKVKSGASELIAMPEIGLPTTQHESLRRPARGNESYRRVSLFRKDSDINVGQSRARSISSERDIF